ncbi:MAG: helix-turn-helix domain-containing protein [Thermococcus sp.]|uniref:helix-turn-helix domain-containing protein n=1 Tax=Thermococcus sp. TaxID=35749 RepID=UPI001E115CA8|nr:helix-turn-helix domain-containing protein [Thermococcus sp.]MBO8175411.1 helix-turn-helix domain-containing protein [Thermococcus sp.]
MISQKVIEASHLTIEIPDTGETMTIKLNPFYKTLMKAYNAAIMDNEDLVILINAYERKGKSTLARIIGYIIDSAQVGRGKYFNLDNVYFSPEDVAVMFNKVPDSEPGTVHIVDEAQNVLHRRDAMTMINKLIDKGIKTIGEFKQVFIFNSPAFWELDVILRRADILLNIPEKGHVEVYTGDFLNAIKHVVSWKARWYDFQDILDAAMSTKKFKYLDWSSIWEFKFKPLPPKEMALYRERARKHKGRFLKQIANAILEVTKGGEEGYYTVKQAAKVIGISVDALYKHIQRGNIAILKRGNKVFIPQKELERFYRSYLTGKAKARA